jgi:anti-sigma B factor antagonist
MEEQLLGNCMRLMVMENLTANHIHSHKDKVEELLNSDLRFNEVVLDLSRVMNIDSVGVTFVIGLYKRIDGLTKKFTVAGASEDIIRLFKLMKLDEFFDINS